MNEPNLDTVYPDILQVILGFLNPYYTRVFRMTINKHINSPYQRGINFPNQYYIRKYQEYGEKFTRRLIFYQFAEDYADHPDFRILFSNIKFHKLAYYGCVGLHKRFVVAERYANDKLLCANGTVGDQMLLNSTKFDDISYEVARNKNSVYFLEIWRKMNCPEILVEIITYFSDYEIDMIMKAEPRISWEYKWTTIVDTKSEKRAVQFLLFCRKYGRQTGMYDNNNYIDVIKWFIQYENLAELIKYVNEINRDILLHPTIIEFIAERGNLKLCEWIYINVDDQIFKLAASSSWNFDVIKRCVELGFKIRYDHFWTCNQIRQLMTSGYVVKNIIDRFNVSKYVDIDDLKWAKEAGYSMAGVLRLVFECTRRYEYDLQSFDEMVAWAYENDSAIDWQEVFDAICEIGYTKFIPEIQCAIKRGENIEIRERVQNIQFIKELFNANLLGSDKGLRFNMYSIDDSGDDSDDESGDESSSNDLHNKINIADIINTKDIKILDIIKWLFNQGFLICNYLVEQTCKYGLLDNIKWLVENGAKLTHGNLYWALRGGHMNILEFAISRGFNYDVAALLADIDNCKHAICHFIDVDNYMLLVSMVNEAGSKQRSSNETKN